MTSLKIELIAVGTRPPGWLQEALERYKFLMRSECQFLITEIKTEPRTKKKVALLKESEGNALIANVSSTARVVAMDRAGKNWSTEQFAGKLESWIEEVSHLQFLIGGPNGLADRCLDESSEIWSLSNLTFPHFLVRLLLAEQVYRALMFNAGHPYHK